MTHDAMLLVTGAAIDPRDGGKMEEAPAQAPEESAESVKEIPEGLQIPERTWTNQEGRKVTAAGIYQPGEDFFWMQVEDEWLAYPPADLAEGDRAALAVLAEIVE